MKPLERRLKRLWKINLGYYPFPFETWDEVQLAFNQGERQREYNRKLQPYGIGIIEKLKNSGLQDLYRNI